MKKTLFHQPRHITTRHRWPVAHNSGTTQWKNVIFFDESCIKLARLNGCMLYWHDLKSNFFKFLVFVPVGQALWILAVFQIKDKIGFAPSLLH